MNYSPHMSKRAILRHRIELICHALLGFIFLFSAVGIFIWVIEGDADRVIGFLWFFLLGTIITLMIKHFLLRWNNFK